MKLYMFTNWASSLVGTETRFAFLLYVLLTVSYKDSELFSGRYAQHIVPYNYDNITFHATWHLQRKAIRPGLNLKPGFFQSGSKSLNWSYDLKYLFFLKKTSKL